MSADALPLSLPCVGPDHEYRIRHDVLEKPRVLRLVAAGLAIESEDGRSTVLPWADIKQVRLRFFPTRVQTNRFECLIFASAFNLKFSNEFYQGIAQFDDRSADYRRFVTALCPRIAAANPTAAFLSGREVWVLCLEYGFLAAMALLLGWILWLTGGPLSWLIWAKLGLIAVFLPTLIRYLRSNRPAAFDPHVIPEPVLPKANPAGGR